MTAATTTPAPAWLTLPGQDARRAAFIARLTASATHEIRNVLAIVKESAGLIGDLTDLAGPGVAPDAGRVRWSLERIRIQVARGADLSTSLNRIMHGLDQGSERLSLADAVALTVALTRRFAQQGGRRIEIQSAANDVHTTAVALDLYMALVALMEWSLERSADGATLVVQPETRKGGAAVVFGLPADDPGPDDAMGGSHDALRPILAALSATLERDSRGVILLLPEVES